MWVRAAASSAVCQPTPSMSTTPSSCSLSAAASSAARITAVTSRGLPPAVETTPRSSGPTRCPTSCSASSTAADGASGRSSRLRAPARTQATTIRCTASR